MQEFSQEVVGMAVVDARGTNVGRISGIEGGYARLSPDTGVASRMESALSPPDFEGLGIAPEQVVEVTDEYVRIDIEAGDEGAGEG